MSDVLKRTLEEWHRQLHEYEVRRVPQHTLEGLQRYVFERLPPGGFLTAVISNDLKGACERADDENARSLHAIVGWLYNNAPSICWGSEERFEAWLKGATP